MLCFLTHHKCASTALSAFVHELCQSNGLSLFATHFGDAVPSKTHDVSCLVNAAYPVLRRDIDGSAIHIIRDPFDIVVSAYHSHLKTHSLEGWPKLASQRSRLQQLDRREGLHLTAQFCDEVEFYERTAGPLRALREWDYGDQRITTVRIEDLHDRLGSLLDLARGCDGLVKPSAEKYAFSTLSGGRIRGQVNESSHYRSGLPGQWRSELPPEVVEFVLQRCKDVLARYYPESLAAAQLLLRAAA